MGRMVMKMESPCCQVMIGIQREKVLRGMGPVWVPLSRGLLLPQRTGFSLLSLSLMHIVVSVLVRGFGRIPSSIPQLCLPMGPKASISYRLLRANGAREHTLKLDETPSQIPKFGNVPAVLLASGDFSSAMA